MRIAARRSIVASLVGLATAVGAGVGVAPASAAPVTVLSPIKIFSRANTDITSTTVDFDRTLGRLSATVVLRGNVVAGRSGGPIYTVYLYGPQGTIGGPGQGSVALSAVGFPAAGELAMQPTGTDDSVRVPVSVRYVGNRVEFRASDDRLRNLPLHYLQVQSSLYPTVSPTDYFSTDGIYGRRIG